MAYGTVTVATTATKILSYAPNARGAALIANTSSGTVFLGFDSSVTTSNGFPLLENNTWSTNENRCYQGEIWGIVASGTSDVRYMEML